MFVSCVPRNSAEFSLALNLEQSVFGHLSVPPEMAHVFFRSRPEIYQAIVAEDGAAAAFSSAFPLKPRWARALIAGDISEPELEPHMLLGRNESLDGATLYIGSVVVADRFDPVTRLMLLASVFTWRAEQIKAGSARRLSVIMTPVTREGERMARHGGVKLLNDGANRKDGYPVCGREVSHAFLIRAAAAIARVINGPVVEMLYNFPRTAGRPPRRKVAHASIGAHRAQKDVTAARKLGKAVAVST